MFWYPYSQMKTMDKPIELEKAEGCFLYLKDGTKLLDSISSWWSVIHGYNNKRLNDALKNQIGKYSHVMSGGIKQGPSEQLTKLLVEVMPKGLENVFYSDSGSVAVEVALKMAIQYFVNKGMKREKIISLTNSYHGDTFMTMAVGDDPDYHGKFEKNNNVINVNPNIEELKAAVKNNKDKVAAFIVEPLLQCGGGFKIHDVNFLKEARQICNDNDIIFIFDEVATGFGRTGEMFVSNSVAPDIVVLGKALTAGYIGHAATIANKKIWDAFYDDDADKAFMHGPTFMANALACSVSIESLNIFKEENYLNKIKNINKILKEELSEFKHPLIKEVRIIGACAAIEMFDSKLNKEFKTHCHKNGIWNRPFLNNFYTMPPYTITDDQLKEITKTFKSFFEERG